MAVTILFKWATSWLSLLAVLGVVFDSCSAADSRPCDAPEAHQSDLCVLHGPDCQEHPSSFLVQMQAVRGRIEAKDAPPNAAPAEVAAGVNATGGANATAVMPTGNASAAQDATPEGKLTMVSSSTDVFDTGGSATPQWFSVSATVVEISDSSGMNGTSASADGTNGTGMVNASSLGEKKFVVSVASNASAEAETAIGEQTPPTDRELTAMDSEKVESSTDVGDLGGFFRGGPQIFSILVMMLLPTGICAVMYCLFNIIKMMEDVSDVQSQDVEDATQNDQANGNQSAFLGEMLQKSEALPKRAYEPLCPELLAPSDNECIISLPSLSRVSASGSGSHSMVFIKSGTPIVRVSLTCMADGVPDEAGGGSHAAGHSLERVCLVAHKRSNTLGFCELEVPRAGNPISQLRCNIYRPNGEIFATLEEERVGSVSCSSAASPLAFGTKCYMLTAIISKTRFWIQGNFKERNLVVVSETDTQKPIITVDSTSQFKRDDGDYYRLRVQPKVDAGVVIMALLAIDRLPIGACRS